MPSGRSSAAASGMSPARRAEHHPHPRRNRSCRYTPALQLLSKTVTGSPFCGMPSHWSMPCQRLTPQRSSAICRIHPVRLVSGRNFSTPLRPASLKYRVFGDLTVQHDAVLGLDDHASSPPNGSSAGWSSAGASLAGSACLPSCGDGGNLRKGSSTGSSSGGTSRAVLTASTRTSLLSYRAPEGGRERFTKGVHQRYLADHGGLCRSRGILLGVILLSFDFPVAGITGAVFAVDLRPAAEKGLATVAIIDDRSPSRFSSWPSAVMTITPASKPS